MREILHYWQLCLKYAAIAYLIGFCDGWNQPFEISSGMTWDGVPEDTAGCRPGSPAASIFAQAPLRQWLYDNGASDGQALGRLFNRHERHNFVSYVEWWG